MDDLKRLLAKSNAPTSTSKGTDSLSGHTAAVMSAADALLDACLDASIAAAGLSGALWRERLRRIVRLAAFIHDLGKANDHFQQTVRRLRTTQQGMRHEAVSLWLCWPGQALADWLRPAVTDDKDYVCAVIAAAGHHRKFWSNAFADVSAGAGSEIILLVSHADFFNTLKLGATLDLTQPPSFDKDIRLPLTRASHPQRDFSNWEIMSDEFKRGEMSRVLGLAKVLTLAADVAGSCLPKAGERSNWIKEQLTLESNKASLQGLVVRRLGKSEPRPFQREVAEADALVTLVRAGCGTGKTVAAYLWAATQHSDRKLWVTYPTTGTATEGFRDYLFGADLDARLEHGRANIDIEVFELADNQRDGRGRDRLESVRAWGCDAIACTVDTVLGLIQNHRKSMYAWPALATASVVFDEVHAYDDSLFDALLHFLEAFPGIPSLLMTASLPESRLQRLRQLIKKVHRRDLLEIAGPESLEILPRYRFCDDDPWVEVDAALQDGKKVLWVNNTVGRCINVANEASARGYEPLTYHSRFRYIDRVARHGAVVRAFDPKHTPGAALSVTTQVAEMSLDLSADLLVTDLAPVPALIQRLGRLNRRSSPDNPQPVKPFVVLPFDGLPYNGSDLVDAREWLERLRGRHLSQRDLTEAWSPDAVEKRSRTPSTFRQGGFCTVVGELREATPGVTVLLHDDAARIRKGEASSAALALPMGLDGPKTVGTWPKLDFYPVAPPDCIAYDPEKGGQWRKA